jgi:hypothetical protein
MCDKMLPQEKSGAASQPVRRPLAGLTKEELRALCATHYRAAVAREAQGKEFILRARPSVKTAGKHIHDEWRKAEAEPRTFGAFNKRNPHTRKRFSYTENK